MKEYHIDAVLNPMLSTLEALDKFYLFPLLLLASTCVIIYTVQGQP